MKPERGRIIGEKYCVVEPLAAGGMGSVWRARHVELESEVAVKLLSTELAGTPGAAERFKREARAAARLKSVHLVQIHDFGLEEGQPYMVMELLEGEDLRQRMKRDGPVSLARAVEIVHPVCKALEVAHAAGIVHRDIKPANVFLARSGQDEVVKVLDFGIAKEQSLPLGGQETSGSTVLGSPMYMSPEQARGGRLDHRSDLWSVAVVAFELLTGRQPFQGASLGDVFARICGDRVPLPSELGVTHPGLDEFFRKALARDPDRRHGSALELAGALTEVARGSSSAEAAPPKSAPTAAQPEATLRTPVTSPVDASGRRGRDSDTLALAATTPSGAQAEESGTAKVGARNRVRALMGLALAAAVGAGASAIWRGTAGTSTDSGEVSPASSPPAEVPTEAAPPIESSPQAAATATATTTAAQPHPDPTSGVTPAASPSGSARVVTKPAAPPRPASSAMASPPPPTGAPAPTRLDPVFGVPVTPLPGSTPAPR